MNLEELKNCTDSVKPFSLEGHEKIAKCTKCYDADTVHMVFDFDNRLTRWNCRLSGIDSAEIKSKDEEEKEFAIKSRDFLKEKILEKIVKIKCDKFDKYGRLLITIFCEDVNINELLLKEGYAYKYDGGKKINFNKWNNS